VFLKLEMELKSCSCVGSGVGVNIYIWGSKTSRLAEVFCVVPVEPHLEPVQPTGGKPTVSFLVRLANCRSDWSTGPDTG
jgi:hypothetical protein